MRKILFESLFAAAVHRAAAGAPTEPDAGRAGGGARSSARAEARPQRWRSGGRCRLLQRAANSRLNALDNAYYDLERFGLRFVASPRHADVLIVTGPVTKNMREALAAHL